MEQQRRTAKRRRSDVGKDTGLLSAAADLVSLVFREGGGFFEREDVGVRSVDLLLLLGGKCIVCWSNQNLKNKINRLHAVVSSPA